MEQSAPTCHVCFPESLKAFLFGHSFPCYNFCSACAVTVLMFGHSDRFYLLINLLIIIIMDRIALHEAVVTARHVNLS